MFISCKFCEIFKKTFFMEHVPWLPLTAVLKKFTKNTPKRLAANVVLDEANLHLFLKKHNFLLSFRICY